MYLRRLRDTATDVRFDKGPMRLFGVTLTNSVLLPDGYGSVTSSIRSRSYGRWTSDSRERRRSSIFSTDLKRDQKAKTVSAHS